METVDKLIPFFDKCGISIESSHDGVYRVYRTNDAPYADTVDCGKAIISSGLLTEGEAIFLLTPVSGNMNCAALQITLNI